MLLSQAIVLILTRGLTHATATSVSAVLPLIAGLGLPAAFALLCAPRLANVPVNRTTLLILATAGLLMRAIWFGTPAPLEDDYFRYLWDGAVFANGFDPYAAAPAMVVSDPLRYPGLQALVVAAGDTLWRINFPHVPTIYPGTTQAAFAFAYLIAPFKLDGLRLLFLVSETVTLLLMVAILRQQGASPLWAALYWWNPLPAFMLIGVAHADALLPPLLLGSILLASHGRCLPALALVGLAAGVKLWPVFLAPMLLWTLRREPRRLVAGCAILAAVLLLVTGPLLYAATRPDSALLYYLSRGTNNNAFFAWAVELARFSGASIDTLQRALGRASVLAIACMSIVAALKVEPTLPALLTRTMAISAAVFYLGAQQFPWYAVGFLSVAAPLRRWPLLLASATLPFYYLFFPFWQTKRGDVFLFGTAFLHSVPVFTWLLIEWLRKNRQ